MNKEPLKGKLRFKDEDDLADYACEEIFKCSGEEPNENDPSGCNGCDAQEKWYDKNYSNMVISESEHKEFASKEEIKSAVEWLKKEINSLPEDMSVKKFKIQLAHIIPKAFEDVPD